LSERVKGEADTDGISTCVEPEALTVRVKGEADTDGIGTCVEPEALVSSTSRI